MATNKIIASDVHAEQHNRAVLNYYLEKRLYLLKSEDIICKAVSSLVSCREYAYVDLLTVYDCGLDLKKPEYCTSLYRIVIVGNMLYFVEVATSADWEQSWRQKSIANSQKGLHKAFRRIVNSIKIKGLPMNAPYNRRDLMKVYRVYCKNK